MLIPRDWDAERTAIAEAARAFAQVMTAKPFENSHGLHGTGAFTLYYFMKTLAPSLVVESGFWRGFSTWLIGEAAPQARLVCIDPVLALQDFIDPAQYMPYYRDREALYLHEDFSCATLPAGDPETTVVFFDDHHNKVQRLLQARARGMRHVIFDDNMPFPYTHLSLNQMIAAGQEAKLAEIIDRHDVMPPLWDLHRDGIDVPGLNLQGLDDLKPLLDVPGSYTWMTYVRLKV